MILYTPHQTTMARVYKCTAKAVTANKRFEDNITTHDVLMVLERFNFHCAYCNDHLKSSTWQLDHFYSRASGGKNMPSNLAPACRWCNQMKNALDGYAFIHKCRAISERNLVEPMLGIAHGNNPIEVTKALSDSTVLSHPNRDNIFCS